MEPQMSQNFESPTTRKSSQLFFIVVILLIVAGALFVPQVRDFFKKFITPSAETQLQSEMSGTITEVNGNSIKVKGTIGDEEKDIDFKVSSATVFKKTTLVITLEQIKSGKPYAPLTKFESGQLSDLAPGMSVTVISKGNLTSRYSATATEVNYFIKDVPTTLQ